MKEFEMDPFKNEKINWVWVWVSYTKFVDFGCECMF